MTTKQPIRRMVGAALLGLALVALAGGGCVDPTDPRYPTDQDEGPNDDDNNPDDQGMIIGDYELVFV